MARTIDVIQNLIIEDVQADPTLTPSDPTIPGLTSTSKFAIWRLWTRIVATAINLLENIIDVFTASVEATLAISAAASPLWVQAKMFLFQYSLTNPQVIQLINTVPTYPVVDPTLCPITQCSVTTDLANNVLIKYAQQNPPIAGTTAMTSAAQSYINTIGAAGITYLVSSINPDQLYVNANIYFNGQYQAVIQANVIAAINTYLATFNITNFGGTLYLSGLFDAILAVPGVYDCFFLNVSARPDGTPFADGTALVQDQTQISRLWNTVSGYIISEQTSGETLADSLNFIAQ